MSQKRGATSYSKSSKRVKIRTGIQRKETRSEPVSRPPPGPQQLRAQLGRTHAALFCIRRDTNTSIMPEIGFEERDLFTFEDNDNDGWLDIPPGEEGMFMSNAGGERDIYEEILELSNGKRCARPLCLA